MGTYAILRALRCYWSNPAYPMHRTETYRPSSVPVPILRPFFFVARPWRPLAIIVAAVLALIAADFLCAGTRTDPFASVAMGMFSICGILLFTIVAIALLLLSYVWPVAVAIRASGAIAREREHRTWDVLLTLPYDRTELLLGRLSAALRGLNVYGDTVLWVQSFLILLIFVLVIGTFTQRSNLTTLETLLLPVLLILVMIEFAIVRAQDYVLAGLIGTWASLVTPTRQMSNTFALATAIGTILIRALCTALPLIGIPVLPANLLLIVATGPSSLIAMTLPIPLAILLLLAIPLMRELIIRRMFGWLVRHMSETVLAV